MTFSEIIVLFATIMIPAVVVVLVLSAFLSVRRLSARVALLESALLKLGEAQYGDSRHGV